MTFEKFDCERATVAVPREANLMGLSPADLALVAEGANQKERTMDEKKMGVVRHVLTAVGAVAAYMGWTDDATWATIMGSLMVMVPMVWSWMAKA